MKIKDTQRINTDSTDLSLANLYPFSHRLTLCSARFALILFIILVSFAFYLIYSSFWLFKMMHLLWLCRDFVFSSIFLYVQSDHIQPFYSFLCVCWHFACSLFIHGNLISIQMLTMATQTYIHVRVKYWKCRHTYSMWVSTDAISFLFLSLAMALTESAKKKKITMNNGTVCLLMVFQLNCSIGFAAKLPDLICVCSFSSNKMERVFSSYISIWLLAACQSIHTHAHAHAHTHSDCHNVIKLLSSSLWVRLGAFSHWIIHPIW